MSEICNLSDIMLDPSIKDLIYWLNEHEYFTTASCSGIKEEHPVGKELFTAYVMFDLSRMSIVNIYRLLWLIFSHAEWVSLESLLVSNTNKENLKLSYNISIIQNDFFSDLNQQDSDSNSIKQDPDILADIIRFQKKIQEINTESISQSELDDPKWSQLPAIIRPLTRFYFSYIMIKTKPDFCQERLIFSQYLQNLYAKVYLRWFQHFSLNKTSRFEEYRNDASLNPNCRELLNSWPYFQGVLVDLFKSILIDLFDLRKASQSLFLWDFAGF